MEQTRRGGPCWPPVFANEPHRIVSPPDQTPHDHEDGRGASPAPTYPSCHRRRITTGCSLHVRVPAPGSKLAWYKPVGAALVGRPSSPTNRTGSCRLPTNATRSRRRAGSKPRPYGPSCHRRRTTTGCSLHVRVPSPGFRNSAWYKPVGAALVGRPSSRTNRHRIVSPPDQDATRSRRRAGSKPRPYGCFEPTPPDNDRLIPCTSASRPRVRNSHGTNPTSALKCIRKSNRSGRPLLARPCSPTSGNHRRCHLPANATRSRRRAGNKPPAALRRGDRDHARAG